MRRLDLFKFEIFQTILRNRSSSILSFYKHQVTSLIWHVCFTRRSYNIFWMLFYVKFVELRGDILGLGNVWQKLYVCGIGLFSYLTYVQFLIFLCWTIYWWLCKQNITWLRRSVRKRCNRISSDITGGRNYPSAGYKLLNFIYL